MGLNDDQLSATEHDAMRSRLLAGTKRIKPVGAHRKAIITTTVAVALVAGLSAAAIGSANFLRADDQTAPIATPTPTLTPSATPTATATSTPTPTSALTPTPSATPTVKVVARGECDRLLTAAEVADIAGQTLTPSVELVADDPALIGGISCEWRGGDSEWLGVGAFPASAVPASVADMAGRIPECTGGGECAYAEVYGDAWVVASAWTADEAVRAVQIAGPRAGAEPGTLRPLPAGAWAIPACDDTRALIARQLGRSDLTPYAGDAHPQGMQWDVLVWNGLVSWCSVLGEGGETLTEHVEVSLGPGNTLDQAEAIASTGATEVAVAGARRAWFASDGGYYNEILAVTETNTILVSARFLDQQTLIDLTRVLIADLDGTGLG